MDNKILGSVLFLSILGIFFLGNGITGMMVGDEYTGPLCENDNECSPDVCCNFKGSNSGVCDKESMCASINEISEEKYSYVSEPKETYLSQLVVGALILVGIFFIMYFAIHH